MPSQQGGSAVLETEGSEGAQHLSSQSIFVSADSLGAASLPVDSQQTEFNRSGEVDLGPAQHSSLQLGSTRCAFSGADVFLSVDLQQADPALPRSDGPRVEQQPSLPSTIGETRPPRVEVLTGGAQQSPPEPALFLAEGAPGSEPLQHDFSQAVSSA